MELNRTEQDQICNNPIALTLLTIKMTSINMTGYAALEMTETQVQSKSDVNNIAAQRIFEVRLEGLNPEIYELLDLYSKVDLSHSFDRIVVQHPSC